MTTETLDKPLKSRSPVRAARQIERDRVVYAPYLLRMMRHQTAVLARDFDSVDSPELRCKIQAALSTLRHDWFRIVGWPKETTAKSMADRVAIPVANLPEIIDAPELPQSQATD